MLEKTFQPAEIEPRIDSEWEKAQAFKAGRAASGGKNAAYAIVIPPPNVTGSLHMGHALTIRCRIFSCASSACADATCCGSPARTTPV